jgi:DNA processing protein
MKDNLEIESLSLEDHPFFSGLKHIPSPPTSIYLKGILPQKNEKVVAIVGTRKASSYGEKIAYDLAYNLTKSGFVIVSGLALGIDSQAHQGALDAGGITVAVLANGLDEIYPATNQHLAEKIIKSGGCLLSEYPPKTPSYPNQFILRNRIISGLAAAVIVVEAPKKSGALATADFAKKQGRPVFAVPGPVSSKNFEGSHQLIRNGAKLISNADDFLSDMGWEIRLQDRVKLDLDSKEKIIFEMLGKISGPVTVDNICQITKLKPRDVMSALSSMILKEIIFQEGGKYQINL